MNNTYWIELNNGAGFAATLEGATFTGITNVSAKQYQIDPVSAGVQFSHTALAEIGATAQPVERQPAGFVPTGDTFKL